MVSKLTIARPYARAVFSLADDTESLDMWLNFLYTLSDIVADVRVLLFLKNPLIENYKKVSFLLSLCVGYQSLVYSNFIMILSVKNRLTVLSEIYFLFKSYLYRKRNSLEVIVVTAFLLKADEQKEMLLILTEKFNKKVFVSFFVNPFLLGGVLIKAGNNVFDSTVKESLIFLRNYLLM